MRDGGEFDKCFYVTRSDLLSLKSEIVLRHVPPHLSLLVPHPNSNLKPPIFTPSSLIMDIL